MKYFWKINIYEIQAILYWILGVLILNLGNWHWLGWIAIAWGWMTFVYTIIFTAKKADKLRDLFNDTPKTIKE